jgi:hypothetical protein
MRRRLIRFGAAGERIVNLGPGRHPGVAGVKGRLPTQYILFRGYRARRSVRRISWSSDRSCSTHEPESSPLIPTPSSDLTSSEPLQPIAHSPWDLGAIYGGLPLRFQTCHCTLVETAVSYPAPRVAHAPAEASSVTLPLRSRHEVLRQLELVVQ